MQIEKRLFEVLYLENFAPQLFLSLQPFSYEIFSFITNSLLLNTLCCLFSL